MKIIKQTLFKIEFKTPENEIFFVEADSFEEASIIAKEVLTDYHAGWDIKSITSHAPLFKSVTKESI